jgi:multidrug efflux system outer membrane protein
VNPIMTTFRIGLIGVVALVASCAVGPDYQTPATPPAAIINTDAKAFAAAAPAAEWWNAFEDPVLDGLVRRAIAGNLDLKVAVARVREARALFADAKLDRYPRVTTGADYTRSDEQVPGFTNNRINVESADIGFDAAWEIDLFGHVQRGIEASAADTGAAEADARDAQVTVTAEVARNYFELRGAQQRRVVAEHNAETQRETLKLTKLRRDVGRGDPVDYESARARLSAIEATIPTFVTAETQARYRLAVLIGERPGAVDAELGPQSDPPRAFVKPLPIGDASQFLRRRPDVQAAERRLAAQTARVGVATADLFPRVRVTGFIGLLSGDVSSLFTHGAEAWSVGPAVTWPGLDFGGAKARLRAAEARNDVTLASYDQTVLRAVEDLEDSLVAYRQQQTQLRSLAEQVDASRRAADLARARYREGTVDFLVLLDAQRTQLAAEDALSVAETDINTDVVAIYKALGGGWS